MRFHDIEVMRKQHLQLLINQMNPKLKYCPPPSCGMLITPGSIKGFIYTSIHLDSAALLVFKADLFRSISHHSASTRLLYHRIDPPTPSFISEKNRTDL